MTETLTDDQIKHMVEQFLGWKLPQPWHPDGGISFEPVGNKGTIYEYKRVPSGTNLFDYSQAKEMVLHMIDDLPTRDLARFPLPADADEAVAVQWQRAMKDRQRNRDLPDFSLPASAFPDLRTGGGGTLGSPQKCIRQDCDCFDKWNCSRRSLLGLDDGLTPSTELPEGWIAAPREPEGAMVDAARDAAEKATGESFNWTVALEMYRAMLAVIPTPNSDGGKVK